MVRVLAVLVGELLMSACMMAQAAPNAPVQVSSEEIAQWLQGGDQRLVAWGAYFAAQHHELAAVSQLDLKIESWQPLPAQEYDAHGNYVPRSQEQRERSEVMAQVLDAQIQLNGTVSSQAVEQLGNDFPAQALILFARLPEPERTDFARLVYKTRRGAAAVYDWRALTHDEMVHMAAAILAQHPPDGFTASLLNETSIVLNINVTDEPQQARPRWFRGLWRFCSYRSYAWLAAALDVCCGATLDQRESRGDDSPGSGRSCDHSASCADEQLLFQAGLALQRCSLETRQTGSRRFIRRLGWRHLVRCQPALSRPQGVLLSVARIGRSASRELPPFIGPPAAAWLLVGGRSSTGKSRFSHPS